ncbi:MAG TPA: hypothetical protein PLU17_08580, partial [Chitinophagaceae bacterium]|nr:hypothetical protein [Chitinophagaceae bacterium]
CFTGLPAGNYCVMVKDTCTGCDTCICVTITQPAPIILTANSITVCPCNSSITVNAIGGTPCTFGTGYTYQIFPGGAIQASPTFNGLCAGCYTIVVKDCNQCTASIVKCVGPCGGGNPIIINLTAYLQGYYVGSGMMRPVLFNQGVSTNTNLTDQITVELTSSQFPYQLVASTTTDLMTNGQAIASFNSIPAGLYYVVLKHRNSIQTWSAGPVPLSPATTYNYDFTASQAQAYGNNMIEVEPGVWAIYTGDINQDENIDLTDYTLYESDASNFLFGYLPTDIDGDGTVDLLDSPILENNLFNFIFSSHP